MGFLLKAVRIKVWGFYSNSNKSHDPPQFLLCMSSRLLKSREDFVSANWEHLNPMFPNCKDVVATSFCLSLTCLSASMLVVIHVHTTDPTSFHI